MRIAGAGGLRAPAVCAVCAAKLPRLLAGGGAALRGGGRRAARWSGRIGCDAARRPASRGLRGGGAAFKAGAPQNPPEPSPLRGWLIPLRCAQGFDEYMNLVLDNAEEVSEKKGSRKALGKILLKGENITLMRAADGSGI